jgi:hypothetical protein
MPAKFPEAVYIPKGDIIDGFNLPFTAQDFCMVETVLQRSTANVLFFISVTPSELVYHTFFSKINVPPGYKYYKKVQYL